MKKHIQTPLDDKTIESLVAGDWLYLSGSVYTARDAAHLRLVTEMGNGQAPPFEFQGQAVYYAGPCPQKPGQVIGSVGPTTSSRMDAYSPFLISHGLKVMIGKGLRSPEVAKAIFEHRGVYLAAIGGAAALMSQWVKAVEVIAYADLGTEAIRRLTVENWPLMVVNDAHGNDFYRRKTF